MAEFFPNVWGQGAPFAFSGLDGENRRDEDFAGHLSGERVGVVMHTKPGMELYFALHDVEQVRCEVISSDLVRLSVTPQEGQLWPVDLVFARQNLIIGRSYDGAPPNVCVDAPGHAWQTQDVTVLGGTGACAALAVVPEGAQLRFAFAYGATQDRAVERARAGLQLDLDALIAKKQAFYDSLPKLNATEPVLRLMNQTASVLKAQVYSAPSPYRGWWVTPQRLQRAHMLPQDSVLQSVGGRLIDPQLGARALLAVLELQLPNGMIALVDAPADARLVLQPPLLAWGFLQHHQATGDNAMLLRAYEGLRANLFWYRANCDRNCNFLYEWPDRPEDALDFSCFIANETRCMAQIAEALGNQAEQRLWESWNAAVCRAVNRRFWNAQEGCYGEGDLLDADAFLTLFSGVCSREQARKLADLLKDRPERVTGLFLEHGKGPVWVWKNYMIIQGLRDYGYDQLADRLSLRLIDTMQFWYEQTGLLYERYDGEGRVPPGNLDRVASRWQSLFDTRNRCLLDSGAAASLLMDLIVSHYAQSKRTKPRLTVTPVASGEEMWVKTMYFARNCSWGAGIHLARLMSDGVFTGWERVFVAQVGDQMAGYCTFARTDCLPDETYSPFIGYVFVAEEYRGHRISQRLIEAALDYAKEQGFEKVYLVSDHVGLYEKYGFEKIDTRKDIWGNTEAVFVHPL